MNFFNSILAPYHIIYEARQRLMKMPTDPKEIHRRANLIRDRLKAEKRLARLEAEERVKLKENLDLIDFDMRMRQK